MLEKMKKKAREHDFEIRRALATGYALALVEHGIFVARPSAADASEEDIVEAVVLEFADWFASRGDWSLHRAYRHWRAQIGESLPEVSIPPQTPRSAEAAGGTERLPRSEPAGRPE